MVGTNKILTVSYGTFSCTLEGFDDPFSTMRSIAEYFRDLAADDRYFGAEPPTPDAEMLHRIAEREVQRRVEAQVQTDGILLRQVEEDNAAAVDQFDNTAKVDEAEETEGAATHEEAAEAEAPEVPAESSESVAEKLSRIRAVVARTREAEEMLVDHDGADMPEDHVEDAEAVEDDTQEEISAEAADDGQKHEEEGTWTPEPDFEEPDLEVEDEHGEDTEIPADMSDEHVAEDQDAAADEAEEQPEHEVAEEEATEVHAEVVADDSEESEVVMLHGEAEGESEEDSADEDPLSLETPWNEFEDSAADDADVRDAAEPEETASEHDDLSEDLVEEPEADSLTAGIRQAIGETQDDDEDEARGTWNDADDELDDAARQSQLEENLYAGQIAARDRLGVDRDETEESGDVERLLEETDSQLADTEASRRRSAIAHLKAAVAATKADRLLKRVTAREKNEVAEQAQYRDDLAQVVRPRRPAEAAEHHSERPAPLDQNKAPLMLISELRVDEETGAETANSIMPVRPRRVSADDDDSGDGAGSFAEFAKEMGATELPDLLEAAAAYAAFVENRPHFSRPQLMKRVAKYDRSADFSREDGLRSFGQLLRQGKIQKLKRGQFTVAETTRFNPDSRIAGE